MKKTLAIVCIVTVLIGSCFNVIGAVDFVEDEISVYDNEQEYICNTDDAPVYFVYETSRWQTSENISLLLKVDDVSKLKEVSYESEGFNMLTETETAEGIDIELEVSSNEAVFTAAVTYDDELYECSVYVISTDRGTFISRNSFDSARDLYYYSGVEDGLYDVEEYNRLINAYYNSIDNGISCETIVSGNSNARAAAEFTVKGTLTWKDDSNVSHPLQYNKVEVYTSLGLTATLYTNASGFYSVTIPWLSSETAYIKVYPGNSNSIVTTANGGSYAYQSPATTNISKNQTVTISPSFTMSTAMGQAFQISQAINVSTQYVKAMRGSYITASYVKYPHEIVDKNNCFYEEEESTLYIVGEKSTQNLKSYAAWDVLMHEYGHHVQYYMGIENNPGGTHSFSGDLAEELGSKDKGIRLAWGEAYATVFGVMAQQYYISSLQNIATVGDTNYRSYNGTTLNLETVSYLNGEACEGSICGVLWDMFDTATESHDTMSMSHSAYWNMITNCGAKTMSDFATYFSDTYPQYCDKFGELLSYYRMAAYSITYNSANNKISWNVGGTPSLPNNNFFVCAYDSSGNQLLERLVTVAPTSASEVASYTFSAYDRSFFEDSSVIKIVVIAYQNDIPQTGDYRSAAITVNL